MRRGRTTLCLFLVALLLLSGCNAFSGSDTKAPTVTPADVPTDRPTPTQVHTLAPGLTQYGVGDPIALGNAHNAVLSNTSYTYIATTTEKYTNGTLRARQTVKARVVEPKGRYYAIENFTFYRVPGINNMNRRIEYWSNGTLLLSVRKIGDNTSYQKISSPAISASYFSRDPRFYALFGSLDTRVVGRKTHDETTLYRLKSTEITDPTSFSRGMTNRYENPRNVTFQALIDFRGVVHEYRLAYTATGIGMNTNVTTRIVETVRYTEIGSTNVERPSWYEKVANQSVTPSRSR
jgi:hypothetical protein